MNPAARGMKAALAGLLVNIGLVAVKLIAGIVGHSYALIADAVESCMDVFSSMIVWYGLKVTTRPADEDFPYGYGKAEGMAGAVVALMLLGAALGITVAAVGEIVTPHHAPAPFTLAVIPVVILVKEVLFRVVARVGRETGSIAVKADAWHHRSDAITSAAAFVGIAIALWGGPGWESADDFASIAAAVLIAANGVTLLRPAVFTLMDKTPEGPVIERVAQAAASVEGVLAIEKLRVRPYGLQYVVDLHVQADPLLSLNEAHVLSGKVKGAIRDAVPGVITALIHMEPYSPPDEA